MKTFTPLFVLLAALVFTAPTAEAQRRHVYDRTTERVQPPPPPPRVDGRVWVAGHWEHRHGRRIWIEGRWVVQTRPVYRRPAPRPVHRPVHRPAPRPVPQPVYCPPPPAPRPIHRPLHSPVGLAPAVFQQKLAVVRNQRFESTRMEVAINLYRGAPLTVHQIRQIMQSFSFESSKLRIAKLAYAQCVNPQNYPNLYNEFTFESSVRELNRFIY